MGLEKRITREDYKSKHDSWNYAHSLEIKSQYAGKWIAVYESEVIASSKLRKDVVSTVMEGKYNMNRIVIHGVEEGFNEY